MTLALNHALRRIFTAAQYSLGESHCADGRADAAYESGRQALADVEDDWYSEAINFRFLANGVWHRGLITYEALEIRQSHCGFLDSPLAVFLYCATEIRLTAAGEYCLRQREPIVLVH
jgi:hypothetical protein